MSTRPWGVVYRCWYVVRYYRESLRTLLLSGGWRGKGARGGTKKPPPVEWVVA
ncbi:hypothetical protein [Rubritalea tangerina]|uniref:hypothetical protein n=1 Tax=Rubritalea tangerina TaxID=430798 RepID=UPI00361B5AD7